MYWYIVHLKVYIVYTLYLESRHVILPFWKLLPVDGFKPTMHAVQQMVVWHSLHGSVYRSEASEIHESSCLATRKDILTCWNSRPCDDAWLPIFDLFWVQPRTRQRWCCREGGSIHAIVASQQGPHEWQGHDGCPTPTSRCLCLDLADAVRFVCPKSNETLLTPGDIATSTRISLYKGSYIGSFILTQFIWTSGISLRSRFPRYDQSFCPDQKSVLRTEKIERHEKAQKTVSVRFTCEFLLTWLWHPAFIWWNGPLLGHLWPGMPGSMGGNTPIGMAMGGHMTEQMEDQIRNMMQQVLMPFQDQVMSKLCSVEENLHRQLDGVLATHDAIYIYILYTRRIWIIYTHWHMWLNFLHFRARIREIHSQRKRQPQIDVNPRLSNSGIPVFPNKWPVANRLYRISLRFEVLKRPLLSVWISRRWPFYRRWTHAKSCCTSWIHPRTCVKWKILVKWYDRYCSGRCFFRRYFFFVMFFWFQLWVLSQLAAAPKWWIREDSVVQRVDAQKAVVDNLLGSITGQ